MQETRPDSTTVFLFLCSLGTYIFSTVYFKNYLYADGAGYFSSMLANNGFQLWPMGRVTSQILMQIFAFIGIRAGITDVGLLGGLFGFGITFWTALFYILTFWMLIQCKRPYYIGILIFGMSLSLIFTGFFVQIESLIAMALFAYCFFGILLSLDPKDKTSPNRILLWIASALTICMNEYYLIWGFLLVFLIVWKSIRKEIAFSVYWQSLNVLFIISVITAYFGLQVKGTSDLMGSIRQFPKQIDFIVLMVLTVILILLSVDYGSMGRFRTCNH